MSAKKGPNIFKWLPIFFTYLFFISKDKIQKKHLIGIQYFRLPRS